jgi:possible recombination protein, phage associated|nr:MAG: ERF superfamily protein [Bacteriophage sp.]
MERNLMNRSETITEIAKALAKFQSEVSDPNRTKENAFLKSKYVTLDSLLQAVRPVLASNGLSFLQVPFTGADVVSVTTMLLHESGEWLESDPFTLPLMKKDPQGVGSVVTYARRYSLSSILGVAWDEDDDAQSNNETELTKGIKHEISELAKIKNVTKENAISYMKTTFNKSSTEFLDLQELQQFKAWLTTL